MIDKLLAFGAIVVAILAFIAGRSSVHCPELETQTEIVSVIDTIEVEKKAHLTWTNPVYKSGSKTAALLNYSPGQVIDTNAIFKQEDGLRFIKDSVSNGQVGLTFEHLVRGEIIRSDYNVTYPEITIKKSDIITRIIKKKQGWQTATLLSIATPSSPKYSHAVDAGILLGYRYEKLTVMGGYSWPGRRVLVMAIREF